MSFIKSTFDKLLKMPNLVLNPYNQKRKADENETGTDFNPPRKRIRGEEEHYKNYDENKNDISVHENENIDLSNFQMKRILRENNENKQIVLEGYFPGYEGSAIVILEKKSFNANEIFLNNGFFNERTFIKKKLRNGVYGTYDCFPTRDHNGINTTVIHPASPRDFNLYVKNDNQELRIIEETFEIYNRITLPCLKLKWRSSALWADNILAHRAEVDKIIYEDRNEESGFVMVPDFKWDGTPQRLSVLAISMKKIRSIRELNSSHLPLLRNIQYAGAWAIFQKYNIPAECLRVYFHYRPSCYHLHVHFTYVMFQSSDIYVDKAHFLSNVIQNIEMIPDYYQRATLSFVVNKNDPLYRRYAVLKGIQSVKENNFHRRRTV